MNRKKWMILCLLLTLPVSALSDALVETQDGFRRFAQSEDGRETLRLRQQAEEVDGLVSRVTAAYSREADGEAPWTGYIGGEGGNQLTSAVKTQDGWLMVGATASATLSAGWAEAPMAKLEARGSAAWTDFTREMESGWHGGWYDEYEAKSDGWAVRVDDQGAVLWSRVYGGTDWDTLRGVCRAADGGYILVGETYSADGDVIGWHDSGEMFTQADGWTIHIDEDGEVLWQRPIGGSGHDILFAVVPVLGGYLAVGETDSFDGDVTEGFGDLDGWAVLIGADGEVLRSTCHGTKWEESFRDIAQGDAGYLAVGNTWDIDEAAPVTTSNGWAVRLTETGEAVWQQRFGMRDSQYARSVVWRDGGWEIGGFTQFYMEEAHWVVTMAPDGSSWAVDRGAM